MTHDTDCRVRDEFRDTVDEIAQAFWDGRRNDALDRLTDLGWEFVGSGVGRQVYRVPTDAQAGPRDSPTREVPCVVKFATPGRGPGDGQWQNAEEITQFQSLPEELTGGDRRPPIFAPVRDWDRDDRLWLSMPEAQKGGSPHTARNRLGEAGWACSDIHRGNVLQMHDTSVIVDYGLECESSDVRRSEAEEVGDLLEQRGADSITIQQLQQGTIELTFMPPQDLPGTEPPHSESTMLFEPVIGIRFMELVFGSWDESLRPKVENAASAVTDRIDWLGVIVSWRVRDVGEFGEIAGDIEVDFDVTIEPLDEDPMPPDIVIDVYDDFLEAVRDEMPTLSIDVEQEIEGEILRDIESEIQLSISQAVEAAMEERGL